MIHETAIKINVFIIFLNNILCQSEKYPNQKIQLAKTEKNFLLGHGLHIHKTENRMLNSATRIQLIKCKVEQLTVS